MSTFLKKNCFELGFEQVQREFLSEREGQVIPCRRAADGKGMGTNCGKSSTGDLEAESIRSRADSMEG